MSIYQIIDKTVVNVSTYGMTIGAITLTYGDMKDIVLSTGAAVLLFLQIRDQILKLKTSKLPKNEKDN